MCRLTMHKGLGGRGVCVRGGRLAASGVIFFFFVLSGCNYCFIWLPDLNFLGKEIEGFPNQSSAQGPKGPTIEALHKGQKNLLRHCQHITQEGK